MSSKIRKANTGDTSSILLLLKESDQYYANMPLDDFFVAEENGRIKGAVQFKKYKNFYVLGAVSVFQNSRGKGTATSLIKYLLDKTDGNTYIFTLISDFFKKFGFKEIPAPNFLPPKNDFECDGCSPKDCLCMVHKHT